MQCWWHPKRCSHNLQSIDRMCVLFLFRFRFLFIPLSIAYTFFVRLFCVCVFVFHPQLAFVQSFKVRKFLRYVLMLHSHVCIFLYFYFVFFSFFIFWFRCSFRSETLTRCTGDTHTPRMNEEHTSAVELRGKTKSAKWKQQQNRRDTKISTEM